METNKSQFARDFSKPAAVFGRDLVNRFLYSNRTLRGSRLVSCHQEAPNLKPARPRLLFLSHSQSWSCRGNCHSGVFSLAITVAGSCLSTTPHPRFSLMGGGVTRRSQQRCALELMLSGRPTNLALAVAIKERAAVGHALPSHSLSARVPLLLFSCHQHGDGTIRRLYC